MSSATAAAWLFGCVVGAVGASVAWYVAWLNWEKKQ